MSSRILKGLYHFTVYTVGIIVLLAAVFVTLVRLALPDIAMYRSEVEEYFYKYMGFPVAFDDISADWRGWTPELTLTEINLLNKAGTRQITHFDKARIQIAPLATILERQFIPKSLVISGFKLTVIRHEDGSISIQDIDLPDIDVTQSSENELAEWFFKQDEIEIQDAQIEWVDFKYGQHEPILLTNVSLKLRNDVGRFQVDGSTNLPENYGKTMDFAFDAFGNLLTSEWSGELYLSASDINPDNWYRNIRNTLEFNIIGGNADLDVWMNWEHAKLERLQGQFQFDNFDALVQDERALQFNNFTTKFLGEKTDSDGWRFNARLENLVTENGEWPDTDISITAEPITGSKKYNYRTSFSYLKIDDLFPVLSNLSFLPEKARDFLKEFTLNGSLHDGTINYDPSITTDDQFSFNSKFDHLTTNFGNKFPSLANITGHVEGNMVQGQLTLEDSRARFSLPGEDNDEIRVTELTGNLYWWKNENIWTLKSDELKIITPDLTTSLTGSISKETGKSHFLDLVINTGEADLEKVSDYIPEIEGFRLKQWLEKVLVAGTMNSASMLYRGYLDDFPFDKKEGRFEIIADISNISFEYSKRWPVVDQLYGEIVVNGRKMQTNIQSGSIYNAEVTKAVAIVDNILTKQKTVSLTGHMRGDIKDLTLFIDQSPLHKHMALKEVKNAMRSGNFGLDLDLVIPLKQTDKKPLVVGKVDFIDTVIDQTSMNIHLDNINGDVSFTGETITSDTLEGKYENIPVTIQLSGSKDKENPYKIRLNGEGDESFIVDRLLQYIPAVTGYEEILRNRMSGTTPWQVQFTYLEDQEDNLSKHLRVTSELKGLEIDMPAPLGKRKYSSIPLQLETILSDNPKKDVQLTYKSDISLNLQLDSNAKRKLQSAKVNLGTQQGSFENDRNFSISGKVDSLSVEDWLSFLKEISSNETKTDNPVLNDIEFKLDIAYLNLFNQGYSDVTALGRKTDWGWSFNLDDDEIKGDIYYPKTNDRDKSITLLLDKLYLNEQELNHNIDGRSFDPATLPDITLEVAEFRHKGREMGRLSLQSSAIYNGASIDSFEFIKDGMNITGNGTWLSDGDINQSKFKIDLHATDMNTMLETFDYDEAFKDGEIDFQIIADWSGSPMDFTFRKLNGRMDMKIMKGQILEINPSAARLFGLLSFQTLPRRLTLDFSDLFGKGLSFDVIEGNFDIASGNAYTNNLFMSSPAADIAISGRIGLVDQDLDQIVTISPKITETMPLAGAIFGPVGIGVGAAIYLVGEMFDSLNDNDDDNLLRYQYTLTGSLEQPVMEKIKESDIIAGS